jgi:CheY-like chemotaxis protein
MLVDDDEQLRPTIAKLIAALAGVEVVEFSSGAAALAALTAAPDTFTFVVSDLDSPHMSGIEFCRRLKLFRPQLQVLLATGSGLITEPEALAQGFCGLIHKPFSVAALRRVIAAAGLPEVHQPVQAGVAPVCLAA